MSTYSLQIKKIRPYNRDILRLKSTDIPPSLDGYSVTYAMIQSPTRYTGDTTIGEFNGTLNMPSGIQNNTITWTNTDWSPAQKGQTIIVDRCTLPLYPTTVTWYITYNVTTFSGGLFAVPLRHGRLVVAASHWCFRFIAGLCSPERSTNPESSPQFAWLSM